jgi:hypothetical protein
LRCHPSGQFQAVQERHRDVDQRESRLQRDDQLPRLAAVASFRDNLNAWNLPEKGAEASSDKTVIIGNNNAQTAHVIDTFY